jgi:hypothetical protein
VEKGFVGVEVRRNQISSFVALSPAYRRGVRTENVNLTRGTCFAGGGGNTPVHTNQSPASRRKDGAGEKGRASSWRSGERPLLLETWCSRVTLVFLPATSQSGVTQFRSALSGVEYCQCLRKSFPVCCVSAN